jgi:hypothetical protein
LCSYSSLGENLDKVNWDYLSCNSAAIHILEKNVDKIDTYSFLKNSGISNINAIKLLDKNLDKNLDKIDWYTLSSNDKAIHVLEKNLDKVHWVQLSLNSVAMHILEKNLDKISWSLLSLNPSVDAIKIIRKKYP